MKRESRQAVVAKELVNNDIAWLQPIVKFYLSIKHGAKIKLINFKAETLLNGVCARVVKHENVPKRHIKDNINPRKLRFKVSYSENELPCEDQLPLLYPKTVSVFNVCVV